MERWMRVCVAALLAVTLVLSGCDAQRIAELEEGLSTEADVRERFGTPEVVWEGPEGSQIYEYTRQPFGHQNYMITIGADGKMAALRQVLTPQNFERVKPGMAMEDVRRLLGKPMKVTTYTLKGETHYDWRYMDGPNPSDSKVFTAVMDRDLRVVRTESVRDPDLDHNNR